MKLKVLLLDIEGTTTPISFVYDVLFPYVREHIGTYLQATFDDPAAEADRQALASETGVDPDSIDDLVAAVEALMDEDRKSTPLKSLQGKIWRSGYVDGSLRGVVFDDVPPIMESARAAGVRVCIYSSGSVPAQKLLFRYSTAGDLTPSINAYFDTTTGPKKEADSYATIARVLGVKPDEVLFCTDSLDEAKAAHSAGVRAVIFDRPGNPPVGDHDFETWKTLEPLSELL